MLDNFNVTIDTLYSAAAGDSRWEDALHAIEDLTGCAGAVIGFVPAKEGATGFNLAGRFTEEQCAIYSELYQPICRRTRYMMEHPDCDVVFDSLLITEQQINLDPVYEWLGQHGLRYFVGSPLPATRGHRPIFSLQRSPAQGHVQTPDIELFKQLRAHVGRALTLADQLGHACILESVTTKVLEALPQALFALDEQARIVFANAAASELALIEDGVSVSAGCLLAFVPGEQASLDRLVLDALHYAFEGGGGWMRISRCSGQPPYAVFVAPLRSQKEPLASAGAKVLVVVHDPMRSRGIDPQVLTSLYGLTDTEARLASAIAAGHSLESAAASLHMRIGTARCHLKAIFSKTGVNRQQDLVRLLTSISSIGTS